MAFLNNSRENEDIFVLTAPVSNSGSAPNPFAPTLGAADSYAVLAASTITAAGTEVVTGNLGLYPGTSVTGFPPSTVSGSQDIANTAALNAQLSATAAYNDLAARTGAINESGNDLGTLTLVAGVYKYNTSAQLTGTLTLDAGGNPNAVWIFQIGSTLTTASASSVNIINGGSAGNVFWQVGTSATLGTTTAFKGTIIANASITSNNGVTTSGRLFALTGAVTFAGSGGNLSATPLVATSQSITSFTLPANALRRPGASIRITAWGTTGTDSNTKTIALRFGGTILNASATGTSSNSNWIMRSTITSGNNRGNPGDELKSLTQQAICDGYAFGAALVPVCTSLTKDQSQDIVIDILGTTVTASDVSVNGFLVEGLSD